MRRRQATPADLAGLGLKTWSLWAEASMVIGMRMLGMAGVWAARPDENTRMVAEKPAAFAASAAAAGRAAMTGKRPDQIAAAAMAPLARKARANRRRLGKAGPKW